MSSHQLNFIMIQLCYLRLNLGFDSFLSPVATDGKDTHRLKVIKQVGPTILSYKTFPTKIAKKN